jgi:hypothetical protein
MKKRKQENIRFIVKWINGNMMYFRAFKRDNAAIAFQDYLFECEKIPPENVRVLMT